MRKLAIFTEGQTEQIFLKSFVEQIGGANHVEFEVVAVPAKASITRLESIRDGAQPRFGVLLYDCKNDERVKSVILDQRDSLARAGYDLILGLRDLYPRPLADLPRVKLGLRTRLPTKGVPTHILLAVAEVEAWFLQDDSHFRKIDAALDVATFKAAFGFDPCTESAETLERPAELLHQIYASVGKAYRKTRAHVQRTVSALACESLYLEKAEFLPHLNELIAHLDSFFDGTVATPAS